MRRLKLCLKKHKSVPIHHLGLTPLLKPHHEPDKKFELPSISHLKVGIFTKGLQQLLEDQRPTKNDST